ncbi:hypothetical protein [Mycoplasmopsis felifaucium]|uniref:hypothetical protein n=1 Tax=Mycoplasmopsis felifaucium TaxID=35768 RepID=UPI00048182CA|nr:hypothetical protein [Mycoplasmopsis felifaucium]
MSKYTEAIFAKKANESNLSLKESELAQISNIAANELLIGLLGTDLPVMDVNKSTVTFLRNIGQTFEEKTKVGISEVKAPKLDPVTFNWNKPKFQALGFSAADEALGLPNAAAIKLERAQSDFIELTESEAWTEFETKVKTLTNQKVVFNYTTKTGKEIWQELVKQAIEVSKTKNITEGISRVQKSKIIIFVKDEVFNKLASDLIIGNYAEQVAQNGAGAIATIGGYKVVANPYLNEFDAIIATTFTAASMVNVNAANITTLVPTNDTAMYYEAMNLFGVAYTSCIKAIAKQ